MVKEIYPDRLTSKEIGYLVGLFIGNGYSEYSRRDGHYGVDYYLDAKRDINIRGCLQSLLLKMGLKPYITPCRGSMRISSNSKKFMGFIDEEETKIKDSQVSDPGYVLGAISGFIDSDGYVGKGDIVIVQKDKMILDVFKRFSEEVLEIPTRLWKTEMNFKGAFSRWNLRISMGFRKLSHTSIKVHRYSGDSCSS